MIPLLLLLACCLTLPLSAAVFSTSDYAGFTELRAESESVSVSWDGVATLAPQLAPLATLDEDAVWAVTASGGQVFAATGGQGRLYALSSGADARVVADLETGQILALCADRRGNVYFGTTPEGAVYRAGAAGPQKIAETGETYVFALLCGPDGELYCATGTNGRLIRISRTGKVDTVFSAPFAHLTTLEWLVEGRELLVGTAPGGLVYRLKFTPGQTKPDASVIYDTGLEEVRAIATTGSGLVAVAANPGEGERGSSPQVACVTLDGALRWTWNCPETTLFALASRGEALLAATGNDGIVFSLDTLGRATLLARVGQLQATSLGRAGSATHIGTASGAAVYRLGANHAASGQLLSQPFDCGAPARFGRMQVRSATPAGTGLRFDTRSGNSSKPDSTWTEWVEAGEMVRSGPGRFIQWRARFTSSFPNLTPRLEQVELYFQVPNRAPVLSKFELAPPDAGRQTPVRALSWEAADPDGDSLVFELQYRPETVARWNTIAEDLTGTSYDLDTRTLPDGACRFRLIASDRLSQPARQALRAEIVSRPVVIDNTPPAISGLGVQGATLTFTVTDQTSSVASCRYSVNAGPWLPLLPEDGVYDSAQERFRADITLGTGENTVAVQAADAHGNTTVSAVSARR